MNHAGKYSVQTCFGPAVVELDPADDEDRLSNYRFLPTRKVRGQRRYYGNLARVVDRVFVHDDWYAHRHWHVDRHGLGNVSWPARRAHLVVLFALFRRVLELAKARTNPYQCFVVIEPYDSAQDAVYIHSPNPNGEEFPIPFGVDWEADVPERLREFMDPAWMFGRGDGGRTTFVIKERTELEALHLEAQQ